MAMRRQDKVFLGLLWGSLLLGLGWALSTQSRWVQESKPTQVQRPLKTEAPEPAAAPDGGTRVIGTVSDDTLTSMSKGLDAPTPQKAEAKSGKKARPGSSK